MFLFISATFFKEIILFYLLILSFTNKELAMQWEDQYLYPIFIQAHKQTAISAAKHPPKVSIPENKNPGL